MEYVRLQIDFTPQVLVTGADLGKIVGCRIGSRKLKSPDVLFQKQKSL